MSIHIPCLYLDNTRVTLNAQPKSDELYVIFGRDRGFQEIRMVKLSEFLSAASQIAASVSDAKDKEIARAVRNTPAPIQAWELPMQAVGAGPNPYYRPEEDDEYMEPINEPDDEELPY